MFYLVDLDHTMSNAFWRDPMIGNLSWDDYHESSKHDKAFPKMIALIQAIIENGDLVIAITGRTEKHRGITVNWLLDHHILIHDLLMRPDDIFLKNAEMKIELVKTYFNNTFDNIGFLIDDNEETCIAFQKLGIATLQARMINVSDR